MMVWNEDDETRSTQPPPANAERIDDLRRLLPLAGERLTEAAAALVLLDRQLNEHEKVLDRVTLAEQRRTAAFSVTVAFEAMLKVAYEVDALGLGQDLEEHQLADALETLATIAAWVGEGFRELRLSMHGRTIRFYAAMCRAWGEELSQ